MLTETATTRIIKPVTTISTTINPSASTSNVTESITSTTNVSDTTFSTFVSLPTMIINTTDDFTEKLKHTEDDADTIVPIDLNENSTTLSSVSNQNTIDKTVGKEQQHQHDHHKTTESFIITSNEVMLQ